MELIQKIFIDVRLYNLCIQCTFGSSYEINFFPNGKGNSEDSCLVMRKFFFPCLERFTK